MEDQTEQTLYLEQRVSNSLAMASAAGEPCAQIAHLTLARLYANAVDTLVAKQGHLVAREE